MAKLHRDEPEVFDDYLKKCAEKYIRAAVVYPPDDEYNASMSPSHSLPTVKRALMFSYQRI